MDKVIVITGPTGVGKTKLSLNIADYLNTDIINGDAFQIYDKMLIGTAAPSTQEKQQSVHHLFNILEPTTEFSVCDYQKLVRSKIDEMLNNKKIPLIVGGSGLYIDSVIADYRFDAPSRKDSNEELYSNLTNEELYNELLKLDPTINPEKLHMNNRKRVLRAIENIKMGNYESHTLKNDLLYDVLVIFLSPEDRNILYSRINQRVDQMINEGLINEVEYLYNNNLFSSTSYQAIGYKEFIPYFEKQITKEDAIEEIKKSSRHYAKRQITWFKHKDYSKFINVNYNNFNQTIEEVKILINEFLNK